MRSSLVQKVLPAAHAPTFIHDQLTQERCRFAALEGPGTNGRETAARAQQCFIHVVDVRQVRREDDPAALRTHDSIRDREETVQVVVAVAARKEHVVGILDHEGIVRAGAPQVALEATARC
ncbi:MAG TPA: hypothetical protein VFV69_07170 [Steroidobacteraceae bacterium]|nr:hypothetical protein [Steroidobacteraceae bacterium]